MNISLIFLLKSTLILSFLYVTFILLIRKETQFQQGRIVLLLIVIFSVIIPKTYLPDSIPSIVQKDQGKTFIQPFLGETAIIDEAEGYSGTINSSELVDVAGGTSSKITNELVMSLFYLSGVIISIGLFLYRLASVWQLIKKSQRKKVYGIRVNVVPQDIPAFTFGRYIVMSRHDFETNCKEILIHELSHIRQGHFFDLMLMEMTKIIFWFNPLVYLMSNDIRQIHEYLADEATIKSGIDSIQYQLLIIQKSVGQHKFALANSFNHCQIKNRITMMNKSKNRKSWNWKVATFLPLLIILLMAFGRKGENPPDIPNYPGESPLESIISSAEKEQHQYDEFKQKIEIRMDGNYINNKKCSLEEIKEQDRKWREASNDWILLLTDESIPLKRVDEVRQSLKGDYWVVQTTVGSDDLIYFAGDVSQLAKFSQGKFWSWFRDQLKKNPEVESLMQSENFKYLISYGFIVDKNGNTRDAHIIQESDYPEINKAYNEILARMPAWEPAIRRGEGKVSVYVKYLAGNGDWRN